MLTPPHKVEEFNQDKETEVLYAQAMDLIYDGKALEGKKYQMEAYELGSFKAGKTLSYGLSAGWFGERDNKASLIILWNLVERGYPGAMNELGLCYEDGIGMPIDYVNAFKWFSKAVENNAGACAERNLARCYRRGRGTPVDIEKAKELEALAVEHGFPTESK